MPLLSGSPHFVSGDTDWPNSKQTGICDPISFGFSQQLCPGMREVLREEGFGLSSHPKTNLIMWQGLALCFQLLESVRKWAECFICSVLVLVVVIVVLWCRARTLGLVPAGPVCTTEPHPQPGKRDAWPCVPCVSVFFGMCSKAIFPVWLLRCSGTTAP